MQWRLDVGRQGKGMAFQAESQQVWENMAAPGGRYIRMPEENLVLEGPLIMPRTRDCIFPERDFEMLPLGIRD